MRKSDQNTDSVRGSDRRRWGKPTATIAVGGLVLLALWAIGLASSEGSSGSNLPLGVTILAVFIAIPTVAFRSTRRSGASRRHAGALALACLFLIVDLASG
jgi:uncharacterized membrane protein SirB2